MTKKISMSFDGYWRETSRNGIPAESGVYLVYVCRYNMIQDTVTLNKLIYIGEAANVRERIIKHEKWSEWRQYIPKGSEICFSFAHINSPDRERAEAALIYYYKPPCNDEYIYSFPFPDTTVESSGQCALIYPLITVYEAKALISQ
jgi:hypothetical protein